MNKKLILLCACIPFCSLIFSQQFNPDVQQELVITEAKMDYDFNPHTASYTTESQFLNALYEGLFSYDPLSLEPVPAIAEDYGVSLDKKTWTFSIRSDAKFSNGERITAYDVRDSWLALLNPDVHAPFASLIDCIEGAADYRQGIGSKEDVQIEAKNKTSLIVRLNTPTEYLSKILIHHAFSVISPKENVYSGAYVLEMASDDEIMFLKNEHYYGTNQVAIPSIRIQLSDDIDENTYKFNMGLSHWIPGNVYIDSIYDTNSVYLSPQFCTEFLFFKNIEKPWDNSDLRMAVVSALPWHDIRSNFYSTSTLVLPIGTYPTVIGTTEQDLEKSKELLQKAGYELKFDEEGNALMTGLKLTFAMPNNEYTREQALLMTEALKKVGILLCIETTPQNRYLDSINGWNAEIFTYTWAGDFADPLSFLELFRESSSLRETSWTDTHFETLLDEASLIEDSAFRYEKLAEAEQYLLDEGIVLPISHPISFNVIDLQLIGGWFPNALDIHPYKDMYFIEQTPSDDFI